MEKRMQGCCVAPAGAFSLSGPCIQICVRLPVSVCVRSGLGGQEGRGEGLRWSPRGLRSFGRVTLQTEGAQGRRPKRRGEEAREGFQISLARPFGPAGR